MAEYIDRDALINHLDNLYDNMNAMSPQFYSGFMIARHHANDFPAADVAPVRHGRWVLGTVEPGYLTPGGNRPWICSECKQVISWSLGRPYENYCPNCGAKMDGGAE